MAPRITAIRVRQPFTHGTARIDPITGKHILRFSRRGAASRVVKPGSKVRKACPGSSKKAGNGAETVRMTPEALDPEVCEEVMRRLYPGKKWEEVFAERGVVRSIEKVDRKGFVQ